MNIWGLIYRFSWALLTAMVAAGLILVFTPKARKLAWLQNIRQQLETESAAQADQIKALQIKQERFNRDPEFVEHTAREAGLVSAHEIMYKFTEDTGSVQRP